MAYTDIDKPSDYFDTITYTGTGANNQQYYNLSSQADLIWCKQRSTANNHFIFDTVRGTTKALFSNLTNAEGTYDSTYVNALDSTSITWGSSTNINESGQTYVNWLWQGGGTAVSNTQGSITSSVSANTTAGFSIVSWTGTGANGTVGHGLGATPSVIITKARTAYGSDAWYVVHNKSWGNDGNGLVLNNTAGIYNRVTDLLGTGITAWSSSTFTINQGSATFLNNTSIPYIGYCWSEVKGFSKFGSYTGNGSTDGTFVYTGFKPAFVIIKASSIAGENWYLVDATRSTYNPAILYLSPNNSGAEASPGAAQFFDFLSNGFKLRVNGSYSNSSGVTYIYMAFAQNPLVGSNGVPCTAR